MQEEGKVPVLDMQLYVGNDGVVMYKCYENPCANKIPQLSAHNKKMKVTLFIEEGPRRLQNCSRGMDSEVRKRVMRRWANELWRSGCPTLTRHQVISEAVIKYRNMCQTEDEGGQPINRAREWQKANRRMDKERMSTAWHNNSQTTISSLIIIDPTVGRLTEKINTACLKFGEAIDMNVVVKVRAGGSVKSYNRCRVRLFK